MLTGIVMFSFEVRQNVSMSNSVDLYAVVCGFFLNFEYIVQEYLKQKKYLNVTNHYTVSEYVL